MREKKLRLWLEAVRKASVNGQMCFDDIVVLGAGIVRFQYWMEISTNKKFIKSLEEAISEVMNIFKTVKISDFSSLEIKEKDWNVKALDKKKLEISEPTLLVSTKSSVYEVEKSLIPYGIRKRVEMKDFEFVNKLGQRCEIKSEKINLATAV